MEYGWVKDAEIYIDPQIAGEVIESIRLRTGDVTPDLLIEDSRPDGAPLHSCFEWDDEAAATEYRREQARTVIRSIRVVGANEDEAPARPVRVKRSQQSENVIEITRRYDKQGRNVRNILDSVITLKDKMADIEGLEEAVACLIDVEDAIEDFLKARKKSRVA